MDKKRIGILRGGAGGNYASSLRLGGDIIAHIHENLAGKYKLFDILIDKDHVWHFNGVPIIPGDLVHKIDAVWNTSHSSFSNILESLSIPNVGVSAFCSTLEKNPTMLKEHMKQIDVIMPRHIVLPVYQEDFDARPTERGQSFGRGQRDKYAIKKAKEIHSKFPAPWIVKSFTEDANIRPTERDPRQNDFVGLESFGRVAIHVAQTFPELVGAIEDGVNHGKSILVEEFVSGKAASVHCVRGFRGEDVYAFPLSDSGNLSLSEKEQLANLAKDLHDYIDAKHYLKSDFVLTPRGKVYLTKIESTPNLKQDSHFCQACQSAGVRAHHIVEHILENTLN